MSKIDELCLRVSEAIRRAERLEDEDPKGEETLAAFAAVSQIEEEIAGILPMTNDEGRIARVGAIRAALKAFDVERAISLFRKYSTETGAGTEFTKGILSLIRGV